MPRPHTSRAAALLLAAAVLAVGCTDELSEGFGFALEVRREFDVDKVGINMRPAAFEITLTGDRFDDWDVGRSAAFADSVTRFISANRPRSIQPGDSVIVHVEHESGWGPVKFSRQTFTHRDIIRASDPPAATGSDSTSG